MVFFHPTDSPMPMALQALLQENDISDEMVVGKQSNFCIRDIQPVELDGKKALQGTIFDKGFLPADFMFGKPIRTQPLKTAGITIFLDIGDHDPVRLSQMEEMYLHQVQVISDQPPILRCHQGTLITGLGIGNPKESHSPSWHLAQYAGGYGGWEYAIRFLAEHGLKPPTCIALDDSLEAVIQFGLNHHFQIVGDSSILDSNFFEQHASDTIVLTDIRGHNWQRSVQFLCFELCTISSPCVSWSLAGSQRGFGTSDGMCLAESLIQCRRIRPALIGVEQVSGFPGHPHFQIFLNLLRWCGYEIILADALEMANMIPPRRARWLCICAPIGKTFSQIPRFQWPQGTQGAIQFDALQELQGSALAEFQPSLETAAVYFAPHNMPGSCKNLDKAIIIRYRLPNLWGSLPTFMAMYSEQHLLQPDHVSEKGLFGFFRKQGDTFRFFTPAEVCLLHGHKHSLLLLKPKAISYRHLGNMITPLHAIAILLPAMQLLGAMDSDLQFQDLCKLFLEQRLRMSQTVVAQDSCAWYIGSQAEVEEQQKLIEFFLNQTGWALAQINQWPAEQFFSPEEGMVRLTKSQPSCPDAMSPSQPLKPDFQCFIMLVPLEYGLYQIDATMNWGDLLAVWNFAVYPESQTFDPSMVAQNILDTAHKMSQALIMLNLEQHQQVKNQEYVPKPLLQIRDSVQLNMYEHDHTANWRDHCNRCLLPDQLYYDSFGSIADHETNWIGEVSADWIEPQVIPNFGSLLSQAVMINVRASVPQGTDILALECMGPQDAQTSFLKWWNHPQIHEWLKTRGRQLNFQHVEDGRWTLLFRPLGTAASQPVTTLQEDLFIRMLKIAMKSITTEQGPDCVFRYFSGPTNRVLIQGQFPEFLETGFLIMLFQYLGQLFVQPAEWGLTDEKGWQFPVSTPIQDLEAPLEFHVKQDPSEINPTPHRTYVNPAFASWTQNLKQVSSYVVLDSIATTAKVALEAAPEQIEFCKAIWMTLISSQFLANKGHQVHLHDHGGRLQIEITNFDECHAEADDLREDIFWELVKLTFEKLDSHSGTVMQLKYPNFSPIRLTHNFPTMQYVFDVLRLWYHWIMPNRPAGMDPRLVYRGRQLFPESSMELLRIEMQLNPRSKVNVVDPCHGGGPSHQPSSKQDHHKLVESGIASILLDYHVQLPQIPPAVATLIQKEGIQKLHTLLMHQNPVEKMKQFEQLCHFHAIPIPDGPRQSKVQGKFQKIRENQYQRQMVAPDPSNFQLKPGFFCNHDGSQAQILPNFSPQSTGVVLATAAQAQEWLKVATGKVADELGVYVLGAISAPDVFQPQTIHAPATDPQGREVLLNGTLLQFGIKTIGVAKTTEDNYSTEAVQIASVTVWKRDYDQAAWEAIVKSPVKAIQTQLTAEGFEGLMGKPWGRVYQDSGVQVKPELATSIQFHATFFTGSKLCSLLRRSGFCRVFLCPKTEAGQPDGRWKVIWLPSDMPILEVETKAASLAGAAGLVRSRRGLGLRVEAANYPAAWQLFKPNQEMPDQTQTKWLFKLHPLPLGVTPEVLRKWAQECYGWSIKPVRAIGAKVWLIGADQVPSEILLFNGHALLLQQVPMRGVKQASSIVAGPRQALHSNKDGKPKPDPSQSYRLGDPFLDPWKQSAAVLTNTQASDSASVRTATSSEPRQITGPVAQRLEQQDARLQAIESAMAEIREEHEHKHQQTETFHKQIEGRLSDHMEQTQKGFEFLNNEQQSIQRAVADAMAKQEQKLTTSFDDLKRLILESSRGLKRTARDDIDSDLESLSKMNE